LITLAAVERARRAKAIRQRLREIEDAFCAELADPSVHKGSTDWPASPDSSPTFRPRP
jgi:hypothetical protein